MQGRDRLPCSPAHGVAARPAWSLLHYVPNDFCAELAWYSLSISIFDLLHFCRIAGCHHQDTVRMACALLPGGESLGVSPLMLMGRALAVAGVTPAWAALSCCGGTGGALKGRAGAKGSSLTLPSRTTKASPHPLLQQRQPPSSTVTGGPVI